MPVRGRTTGDTIRLADLDAITPEFHVADYGAVGDGVTDVTDRIQSAIDDAAAAGVTGGGTVILPPGDFLISSTLTLAGNVVIRGSGQNATRVVSSTLAAPFFSPASTDYDANTSGRTLNGGIESIGITGNGTPVAGTIGVDLRQCTRFSVRDVVIYGCEQAARIGNVAYYNTMDSVRSSGCTNGFLVDNVANDNVFVNCRALGGATGFECRDGADGGLNNVQFYGCGAESWTSYGLHLNSASGGLIDNIKWYGGRLECNSGVAIQTTGSAGNVRWCQFFHPYISGSATVLTDSAFSSSFPNTLDRGGGRSRGSLIADPSGSSIGLLYFSNTNARVLVRNSADSAYRGVGCGTVVINSGFELQVPRVRVGNATALTSGNFALSSGWGDTASIGTISGTDALCSFVVTSAGTGQAANPTVTLTFANGAMGAAPKPFIQRASGDQLTVANTWTSTTTTWVVTFAGTPVAGQTYGFNVWAPSN